MKYSSLLKITYILFLLLATTQCTTNARHEKNIRQITDVLGRTVLIPDTVQRVVCIRPGGVRMVTLAGGVNYISGIEEAEIRKKMRFTHTRAYPSLLQLPVIGPAMGGDAELILDNHPDIIFMASTTVGEANKLQQKLGIPVVALVAGDLEGHYDQFTATLQLIGSILYTRPKADSLISFINGQKAELQQRVSGVAPKSAYLGAITYKGERDLTATDPYYPAFNFVDVNNVAAEIDSALVSPINGTYIDLEQIIEWDPDYIFIDRGGLGLVDRFFNEKPKLGNLFKACRENKVFMVWPYNNYHSNFEAMLLNAWYVGKTVYPERFRDIDIRNKGNEIFVQCYGVPLYDELSQYWGDYHRLDYGNVGNPIHHPELYK